MQQVFQHPRCQNCHIPGDAPLQFDAGLPHAMDVERGPDGKGAPGLPCSTCHGDAEPAGQLRPERAARRAALGTAAAGAQDGLDRPLVR